MRLSNQQEGVIFALLSSCVSESLQTADMAVKLQELVKAKALKAKLGLWRGGKVCLILEVDE